MTKVERVPIDLPEDASDTETIIVLLVGTAKDIRDGKGEACITTTQAAAKVSVSIGRFMGLVKDGEIKPVARYFKSFLFRVKDVKRLIEERKQKYEGSLTHQLPRVENPY